MNESDANRPPTDAPSPAPAPGGADRASTSRVDIARFFDLVSKLPRIVNMGSIQISVASETSLETRLKVSGTATAFRFIGDGGQG